MRFGQTKTIVECMFCNPSAFRGGRDPEAISVEIRSVNGGPIRFSLSEACQENNLLPAIDEELPENVAREEWGGSTDNFFAALAAVGVTEADIQKRGAELGAVIIGWEREYGGSPESRLCADLALSVAVLSRCVGGIYYGAREPDYSWKALFESKIIIDEHLPNVSKDLQR